VIADVLLVGDSPPRGVISQPAKFEESPVMSRNYCIFKSDILVTSNSIN